MAPADSSYADALAVIDRVERRMTETTDQNIVISDLTERVRARIRNGSDESGPLAGVVLAVKDNIDVTGAPTTQGSLLYGAEHALSSASVVDALESAGAHVVAKVNLHEFAYGVSSANPRFGSVGNPTHPAHTPGGSSGGSAAAVGARIVGLALGTDTAGSIRIPAACVGIVGLRPRQGVLDLAGVAPLAPSFDTVGPMAGSVADVAAAWGVLLARAGAARGGGSVVRRGTFVGSADPAPVVLRQSLVRTPAVSDRPLAGVRIGVIDGADADAFDPLGAQLVPFMIDLAAVLETFWPAFRAEVARTHAGTFPALAELYDPNVAAKLSAAAGVRPERYASSMAALEGRRHDVLKAMDDGGLDAIATPTLGCAVPRTDAAELDYRDALGWYAAPFSALNLPALASGNLQLIGRTEADVLAIAGVREAAGNSVVAAPLS